MRLLIDTHIFIYFLEGKIRSQIHIDKLLLIHKTKFY